MKSRKKRESAPANLKSAPATASGGQTSSPSRNRRARREWLFRFALLIGSPPLFFALVEIVLRLFGFGYSTSFFIKNPVLGQSNIVENNKFSRRYFPPELARTPHSLAFTAAKPPDTLRIIVFGESAAEGDPAPAFGFARILEVMLREHYPQRKIEVINTAVTAINSHVIRPIAREAAGYSGDIWVIYMGNNEVVGPFGAGTTFGAKSARPFVVRATLALKATRLGQLLDDALSSLTPDHGPREWAGMEMFLRQQVRQNDARMANVYGNFEENLSDIIGIGIGSGAKVIVSTVGSNLRNCPPFASSHATDLPDAERAEWERLSASGVALQRDGNYAEAAAEFNRAMVLDDQFAELHFRLAQCLAALGQTNEARQQFVLARDLDTLRFRVDSHLNQTIRQVAQSWRGRGASLADAEAALARETSDGIPGAESFYEHVHLTFAGNCAVARELAAQITQVLPSGMPAAGGDRQPKFLSLDESARRLAFTDSDQLQARIEIAQRTSRPPFAQQLDHVARKDHMARALSDLYEQDRASFPQSITIYQSAIKEREDDWQLHDNFAAALVQHGDRTNALAQWKRVVELLPHRLQTYDMIGNLHMDARRPELAANVYREALKIDPEFLQGHVGLGRALLAQNTGAEAIRELRCAVKLQPRWAWTHDLLGQALLQLNQPVEAATAFQAALNLQPSSAEFRVRYAGALALQGKLSEARAQLQGALQLEPQNSNTHQMLEKVESRMRAGGR